MEVTADSGCGPRPSRLCSIKRTSGEEKRVSYAQRQLRLLDGFSKAGGATKGYQRAHFHVTGVDIDPQPNYCGDEFIRGDFLSLNPAWIRANFDAVHASPPCQRWIRSSRTFQRPEFPDLIAPTRALLQYVGLPYVIENVPGAPLIDPVELCGAMFDLHAGGRTLYRHRWFEAGIDVLPGHPSHHLPALGVYGHPRGNAKWGGGTFAEQKQAMGIDWMTSDELAQAIPPAYTEWIAGHLLAAIDSKSDALVVGGVV